MLDYANNSSFQFRSYSDEQILDKFKQNHRSDTKAHSINLFTLVNPTKNDSSLSSLICSICSLPMMKPTILPCKHTFCFKCLEHHQQIRGNSLPLNTHNCLLSNDNHTKSITCQKCFRTHHIASLTDLEENQSIELLINTLLCETCHQLYPPNQLDTCFHCFGVLCTNCYDNHIQNHHNDDKNNLYSTSANEQKIDTSKQPSDNTNNHEKKPTNPSNEVNQNENVDPSKINPTKKKSTNRLKNFINSSRHRHSNSFTIKDSSIPSPSVKKTSSMKFLNRPKLNLEKNIEQISKIDPIPSTLPITPVRRFLNLHDQYTQTDQYIKQCKQRQSELDRSVKKLIDVLTIKTNENLTKISYYWFYLKEHILNQYEKQSNHFQIFDYLLKPCCSTSTSKQQIHLYFQQNDEINASLQVLSTTLLIIKKDQNHLTLQQLFDREEQTTIKTLRHQLDSLLATYAEELTFIIERINLYETRFSAWKNSNITDLDLITTEWTKIIENEYPTLIERISNDFITKVPQIENVLSQMLRHMKKRLLNANNQISSRRTSES